MENWIRLHHVVARLLTPNELNIEPTCFVMIFDLESSLERNVISYFYIRSCLIVYGFLVHLVPRPGNGFRSETQKISTLINLEFSLRILFV